MVSKNEISFLILRNHEFSLYSFAIDLKKINVLTSTSFDLGRTQYKKAGTKTSSNNQRK